MIKRTIEISQSPVHLRVRNGQLEIRRQSEEEEQVQTVPCEDIGLLLVDQAETVYNHSALTGVADAGGALVVCGRNHLPAGLLLPFGEHSEITWRIEDQINIKAPLRKQLWQQIVQAKIRAQARNLPPGSTAYIRLSTLSKTVRSGDPSNIEAQAAKVYWQAWLGEGNGFRRDPDGEDALNILLNYGYTVLRATTARAIVGAGLMPVFGLHHGNRSNAFCLADDLMEPLRPLIDFQVRELHKQGQTHLDKTSKGALLSVLSQTIKQDNSTSPLLVALQRMVYSYVNCIRGEAKQISTPIAARAKASCS